MITETAMRKLVARLSVLPFFPGDPEARVVVTELVEEFADNDAQVDWLGRRMVSGLYKEWPGPHELRACFCSRYRPKDGISTASAVYADGIPSERPQAQLLLTSGKRGDPATDDPALARAITAAAEKMTMPPVGRQRQLAEGKKRGEQ